MKKNSIVAPREAVRMFRQLGQEFALIHNPAFVHPEYELIPLAPKATALRENLVAVVMDMDGTTTTTEELCIHSLEYMVRLISGRRTASEWAGLDHAQDYPHIIGNSTTKHVEYLVHRYADAINPSELRKAFFSAALWTLILGKDDQRIAEVRNNLANLGCRAVVSDKRLQEYKQGGRFTPHELPLITDAFLDTYGDAFRITSAGDTVRAAVDIYYQRYHEILELIKRGEGRRLSNDLLGDPGRHLIEPMPGIGISIALLKGWLGDEVDQLIAPLGEEMKRKCGTVPAITDAVRQRLHRLSKHCEAHPMKLAVVTSSIFYEANIVMSEVIHVLQDQAARWTISEERKKSILQNFRGYEHVYDGFVTASDSNEIRLKPHRDLYSIALHQLGIPKRQFHRVAGFEDSESGTIAIRAAGIGLCVAVPFAKTRGHDLRAASHVLPGGLPEALLVHNLFMNT